jgi:hypothetical protein
MQNAAFCDVTLCGSELLVTANVVPTSPFFFNLIMEALRSSESLVLTRSIRCRIPEDDTLRS